MPGSLITCFPRKNYKRSSPTAPASISISPKGTRSFFARKTTSFHISTMSRWWPARNIRLSSGTRKSWGLTISCSERMWSTAFSEKQKNALGANCPGHFKFKKDYHRIILFFYSFYFFFKKPFIRLKNRRKRIATNATANWLSDK